MMETMRPPKFVMQTSMAGCIFQRVERNLFLTFVLVDVGRVKICGIQPDCVRPSDAVSDCVQER